MLMDGIVHIRNVLILILIFSVGCFEKDIPVKDNKLKLKNSVNKSIILSKDNSFELGMFFYYNKKVNSIFATYRNNTNRAYGATVFKISCGGDEKVDLLLGNRGQAPFEIVRNVSTFHIFDDNIFVKDGKNIKVFDLFGNPVTEFCNFIFGLDFYFHEGKIIVRNDVSIESKKSDYLFKEYVVKDKDCKFIKNYLKLEVLLNVLKKDGLTKKNLIFAHFSWISNYELVVCSSSLNKFYLINLETEKIITKNLNLNASLSDIKNKPGLFYDAFPHITNCNNICFTEKILNENSKVFKYSYVIHKYNLKGDYVKTFKPEFIEIDSNVTRIIPYGLDEIENGVFVVFEVVFNTNNEFDTRIAKYNFNEKKDTSIKVR